MDKVRQVSSSMGLTLADVKELMAKMDKERASKKPSAFVGKEFLQALGSVEAVKAFLRTYDVTTGHEGMEYVKSLGIL